MRRSTPSRALRTLCALALALVVGSAMAQGHPVDDFVMRLTPEDTAQLAGLLADCGGIYSAFGDVAVVQAPDLADDYRDMQNGAMVASAYLLYREHRVRTRTTKPFADFVAPVKSRAEARASQTKALFAADELQGAKDQLGECAKLEELQSLLVRSWREELRPE